MKKTRWLSSFDSLFNMYREDTSTLTHSFILKDPHMQMSYIWAKMMLKRAPALQNKEKTVSSPATREDLVWRAVPTTERYRDQPQISWARICCVWKAVSSDSSHHPAEDILAQFSLYMRKITVWQKYNLHDQT